MNTIYYLVDTEMILIQFPEEILNHSDHLILNIYIYFLQINNHTSKTYWSALFKLRTEGEKFNFRVYLCDRTPLMTRYTKDELEFNGNL